MPFVVNLLDKAFIHGFYLSLPLDNIEEELIIPVREAIVIKLLSNALYFGVVNLVDKVIIPKI